MKDRVGACIAIGAAVGAAIGAATDDLAIRFGIGIGIAMGAFLVGGGYGALMRRWCGHALIASSLAMHGAFFASYQEVDPRLVGLAISIAVAIGLVYLRPPERPNASGS